MNQPEEVSQSSATQTEVEKAGHGCVASEVIGH